MPRLLSQHPLNLYQTYYSSTRESIHYMQIVRHITHNSNPIKLYTQWPRLQWPPLHGPYIINIANHPPSRRRARPMPWYGTRVLRAPDSTPTSLLIDVRSLCQPRWFSDTEGTRVTTDMRNKRRIGKAITSPRVKNPYSHPERWLQIIQIYWLHLGWRRKRTSVGSQVTTISLRGFRESPRSSFTSSGRGWSCM